MPYLEAIKKGDRGEKYAAPTTQEVQARQAGNRGPGLTVHAVNPQGRIGAHPSVDINRERSPAEDSANGNDTFSANKIKKRVNGQ